MSWVKTKMIVKTLIWLIPLFVQSAFVTSVMGGDIQPSKADKAAQLFSPNDPGTKEGGMTDKNRLTEKEGQYLLGIARETIEQALSGKEKAQEMAADLPPIFSEPRGTFVTLTIKGRLRGCIGHIVPHEALMEGIRTNAMNAAFKDPRFRPLDKDDWKRVRIEISILTHPKPLAYTGANDLLKKLRPGIDGVIIKKGYHQSTFLPQVWDQLPQKEAFLNHLCLKAGLDGDEWKRGRLEVSTYQVQAFEESE